MSSDLLGIDIGRARHLVALLAVWEPSVDDILVTVGEAETLSDLPTSVHGRLDEVGLDGKTMASAVGRATDALESFTISLDSPFTVSAALASVKAFDGGDNDPELDRRLRVLRELVEAHTDTDAEATRVMERLLALDQAGDVRFRDISDLDAARAELARLSAMEATGAISGNDQRIDDAVAALRTAVAAHTTSDAQTLELLRALIADDSVATRTVLAAVLTGQSIETVRVAHANNLDYEVARGLIGLARIDELTASMVGAPPPAVTAAAYERRQLLIELAGTDDPRVLSALTTLLGQGLPAAAAFANVDAQIATDMRREHIGEIADAFGLDDAAAEAKLAEMQEATAALAGRGWPVEDAAIVVQGAAAADLDLAAIESLANAQGLSLVEAAQQVATATAMGMTTLEFDAYQGLVEHFATFDNAKGGNTDDVVSISDLNYVVAHPGDFSAEQVAAAAAIIATPTLRHRLDTANDNGDVVGHDPFGATRADDDKFSLTDLEQFRYKQAVNFILGDHVDAIDVANQGGDLSQVDSKLVKADFEAFLDANRANLGEAEIQALELVLEAEWYDKTFWQEHGDSIALAAAVVAGAAIFLATGGAGAGISAMLISTVYAAGAGAAAAGLVTVGGNAISGEGLTDDVGANMISGGFGGMAGAGLVALPTALATGSTGVQVVALLGGTADVTGLTAAGLLDPVLDPFLDDIALANFKADAQTASYVTGALSLTGGTLLGGRNLIQRFGEPVVPTQVFSLDNIDPPPGVVYQGPAARLNSPQWVDSAFSPNPGYTNANHRYTGPGQSGVYVSTTPETAAAEVGHYASQGGFDIGGHVPLKIDVEVANMLDLTDVSVRNALGVTLGDLTSESYDVTQMIGRWARDNGFEGIIAPSVRLPGGTNVVVFDGF